jgi:hypothetical protein
VVGDDTSRIGIGRELPGRRFGSFPLATRAHALNYHIATAGSGYQPTLAKGWSKASTELGAKHQVRQHRTAPAAAVLRQPMCDSRPPADVHLSVLIAADEAMIAAVPGDDGLWSRR